MTKKRVVDNRQRPAQPEPNEDKAIEKPPSVREQVRYEAEKSPRRLRKHDRA